MEWKHYKMDDVIDEISMGPFGSDVKKEFYVNKGIPILNGSNLQGFKLQENSFGYLTEEKADSLNKCNAHRGDIIVTHRGTLGQIVYVPSDSKYDRYVISQSQFRFRCKPDLVDVQFLVYYFHTREGQYKILANASQVGVPALARATSTFRLIDIKLPSLADQRRIASILSSLDRKIELNNKINADLEEMAQAIFKNWFVDFEPFKNGKFVDSELGMIPEGWKVVVFDNILKVTTTKTGKEGIPEYSVTNTGIHPRDEKFTKNLSKSSAKNKLIRKGNLVFGMSREILNWGIMKEEVGGVSSAYNVYIVDEKIVNTTYLECFIAQRMDYFADLIKPASREGQGVDKALLMKKIICIPPSEVMDVFLEKYNSIKLLTEIRNQESSRLSLLRDTLLPRLMSGEIEVPQ